MQTNFEPDINSFARDEYVYWEIPVEKPRGKVYATFSLHFRIVVYNTSKRLRYAFPFNWLTLSMLVARSLLRHYNRLTSIVRVVEFSNYSCTTLCWECLLCHYCARLWSKQVTCRCRRHGKWIDNHLSNVRISCLYTEWMAWNVHYKVQTSLLPDFWILQNRNKPPVNRNTIILIRLPIDEIGWQLLLYDFQMLTAPFSRFFFSKM